MKRIFLGVSGVIVAGLFVIILFSPKGAFFLFVTIPASLITSNWHPPKFFEGQISKDDWKNQAEVSRKFTALLQQKFPLGTSEKSMTSQLIELGFKYQSPDGQYKCDKPTQIAPLGMISVTCRYPARVLEYGWIVSLGVCGDALFVRWSTDEQDSITAIEGGYRAVCL